MATVFDYVNAINFSKDNLFEFENEADDEYVPFVVNRTLSYHIATVMAANDVNLRPTMPKKSQFRFLMNTIPKGKRFGKWVKAKEKPLDIVMEWYKCGRRVAETYMPLLTDEDFSMMEQKLNKGKEQHETSRSGAKR